MFELFIAFLKIGSFSVGGGYAMLPIIYQAVEKFGIMTREDFSNLVAISQITPGPVSINTATYAGFEAYGWPGAFLISLAVCLPCAVFTYVAVTILKKNESALAMDMVLHKMKIAGLALIAISGLFLAEGSIYTGSGWSGNFLSQIDPVQTGLCFLTICLYYKTKLGPILLTLLMAALSILIGMIP
ncbi:chromate transporter [Zhenpiania hominis]|uniref:Chromate transporter n=1 Tax=Zhenpiania hominis TaxID=2763644 RepID=A0A923NMR8_9FIRM|nr:chromate transporter [Zhenpiania hominis]MBC6679849.1 chromate transporter [Zhenpiania hominis]